MSGRTLAIARFGWGGGGGRRVRHGRAYSTAPPPRPSPTRGEGEEAPSAPPSQNNERNIMRPVFTEFALFLSPFVAYALFLWATRSGVLDEKAWSRSRLFWLATVALVLVIASFFVLAELTGSPPRSTYVPAHMENGRLVPGVEK